MLCACLSQPKPKLCPSTVSTYVYPPYAGHSLSAKSYSTVIIPTSLTSFRHVSELFKKVNKQLNAFFKLYAFPGPGAKGEAEE